MNKLNLFYETTLQKLAAFVALVTILAVANLSPLIPTVLFGIELQDKFKDGITSFGFISLLFLGGQWIIKTKIWKLFYKELNFQGNWYGETFYTKLEQPTNKITLKEFTSFSKEHDVFIEQDCLHIAIQPSKGESYATWGSTAVYLKDDSTIDFLYWVNYSDSSKFPSTITGQETLSATKFTEKERKGLPILLTGGFYHCAGKEKPIYSGHTIFVRKGYENKITVNDLPAYARNGYISKRINNEKKI